ncbi:ABC-type nickel/cobalt efflux system, permease component RcnA [Streptomyces wuyuanensis]|uniref:ABC-type nickel/cobalt efflux system, permease component RcnA n=2 Tax=Streptomyces wuyuanensis TaxID=1196353 RepID=A0A1G9WUE5_9ACTN|nr:ABC-type nickel/cobalt efflux system, permease component RcnA [Streptomyces wuyuanensis]
MTDPYPSALAALPAALALAAGARGCLAHVRTPGPGRAVRGKMEDAAPARPEPAVPGSCAVPGPAGRASRTRPESPGRPRHGRAERPTPRERAAYGRPEDVRATGARPTTPGSRRERAAREREALDSTRMRAPGTRGGRNGPRAGGKGHAVRAALAVVAGVAALIVGAGAPAVAHPLGNFSVNRYDGLVVAEGELRVDHVEDLAEIPTARIRPREMAPSALSAWAEDRCAAAAREARLLVDGRAVPLGTGSARATVRPGQAGLPTLRVECAMRAPLPGGRADLAFTAAPGEGAGWREITARGDSTTLSSSDVPRESVSRRLSAYPQRLLESPPARTAARLTAVPGGPALGAAEAAAPPSVLPRGVDRWTQALAGLVERRDLTVPFGALALLIALGLGALHALAPGHGKTLMAAAAAAGGRNSLREVLTLGASVTVTHTLGVLALGALIVAGSAVAPSVVGWLGVASGILVAVAGALLARRAWQDRAHGRGHTHVHWLGGGRFRTYTHTHSSGDDHAHGHERARDGAQEHGHGHGHGDGQGSGEGGGHGHHHEHRHGHEHPAAGHGPHHDHGGDRRRPLRRSILLGLAGGLVPSPSAVVVLVGAAALGHAWFGLLLVIAYGAGLALTLTAAGFAVVRLGSKVAARLARRRAAGRLAGFVRRSAPIGTALTVVALGCGLVLRGAAGALS